MEQLVVILIVGVIALAKWLIEKGANSGDATAPPATRGQTPPARPPQSEDERTRKFLEALGVPSTTHPPVTAPTPAYRRRTVRPKLPISPPAIPTPKRHVPVPPLPESARDAEPAAPWAEPEPKREPIETPKPISAEPIAARPLDIRQMLRTPESVRSAILLREIIGPPRGLQSYN